MREWMSGFLDEFEKIAKEVSFEPLFEHAVKKGVAKRVGKDEKGQKLYTLTPKGREKAETLMEKLKTAMASRLVGLR